MDPDATLRLLRHAADKYTAFGRHSDAELMATLFTALDDWLVGGGFVPTEWGSIRLTEGN